MRKTFSPIKDKFEPLSYGETLRILRSHDDWIVQEAPAAPWYWWLSSLALIHGLSRAGFSPGYFFTYVVKEIGVLTLEQDVLMAAAKKLVSKELQGKSIVRRWIKQWRVLDKHFQFLASKIRKTNLSSLDDNNLASLFADFCQSYYEVETLPLSNEFLIPYSDSIFKKEISKNPDHGEVIATLILPKKKTFLQLEEEELARIGKLSPNNRLAALKKHLEKWYFVKAGYDGPHNMSVRELEKRLHHLKAEKKRDVKPNARVKLGKEIRTLINLSRQVAEWKDERKRNNLIGSCVLDQFAREFSRRFKIPYKLVRYATARDFWRIRNKDPKLQEELAQRMKNGIGWVLHRQKVSKFLTGRQYEQIKRIITSFKKSAEVVNGMIAFPGRVQGKIRIVHHPTRDKFQKGEILLTSMTRPEFIPLMRKAKAILCDEGGLLSHAAIAARELRIPCLVGLGHAMASFKNGDIIEVDANQGTVKKLN